MPQMASALGHIESSSEYHRGADDVCELDHLRCDVRVAESGIRDAADVARVARVGADAVLVGETLMLADDPAATIRSFREVEVQR